MAAGVGRCGRRMAADKRRGRLFIACIGFLHFAFYPSDISLEDVKSQPAGYPDHPKVLGCAGVAHCDVISAFLFEIGGFGTVRDYRFFLVRYPGMRTTSARRLAFSVWKALS
ncbi:hypothetical protein C8R44DRAFT_331965 [Mycena epipterygia]|nr:hypothetical protein C8R44DRAFT_331965 [Mycena epipterygia]